METMKLEVDAAFLATAIQAVADAAELALEMQGSLQRVERKSARDLVTEADYACEQVILGRIREAFPGHAIVAEESGDSGDSEYVWYVDPIDGTINYARGLPLWGISVACCHRGKPVAGVIGLPALGQTYTATAVTAACCNGEPIAVSEIADPEQAIVLSSDFNTVTESEARESLNAANVAARKHHARHFMRSRCLGAAVVEAAWVAAGHVEAYQMLRVNAWDIAAGTLIVARAGGRVTGVDGSPWHPGVNHALVSNGLVHEELVRKS